MHATMLRTSQKHPKPRNIIRISEQELIAILDGCLTLLPPVQVGLLRPPSVHSRSRSGHRIKLQPPGMNIKRGYEPPDHEP